MTQNGWSEKEAEVREHFITGIVPEALYQLKRAENKTEQEFKI